MSLERKNSKSVNLYWLMLIQIYSEIGCFWGTRINQLEDIEVTIDWTDNGIIIEGCITEREARIGNKSIIYVDETEIKSYTWCN